MKALRWIGAAAVWAVAIAAIIPATVEPLRCNDLEAVVEQRTLALNRIVGQQLRVADQARRNIDQVRPCMTGHVNRYMLAASNARMVNDNATAAALYREALRYDNRPEVYLNLGLAESANGEDAAAVQHLTTACLYDPEMVNEIEKHHQEVQQNVWNYQLRMEELKRTRR